MTLLERSKIMGQCGLQIAIELLSSITRDIMIVDKVGSSTDVECGLCSMTDNELVTPSVHSHDTTIGLDFGDALSIELRRNSLMLNALDPGDELLTLGLNSRF